MGAFDTLSIASSSMGMHQTWIDAIAYNIANVNTVRPTSGNAFQAQYVMAQPIAGGGGVEVSGVALGDPQGRVTYMPDSPLADANGYVREPDIDMSAQMGQLIMAQRGFQASASITKTAQETYNAALAIGRP